jgi:ribokinase
MTLWCFGSVNIDHFYSVPRIPAPGETIAATGYAMGLGGKGANQSVAAARAGAETHHIGAVGPGAEWVPERLQGYGVGTAHLAVTDTPTGHANITVAEDGENAIVILPGANAAQDLNRVRAALDTAAPGDLLLLQNETTLQAEVAELGHALGLRVVYSAAPFDAGAVRAVLPFTDLLLLNELEAAQLEAALGSPVSRIGVPAVVVTLGAKGARWVGETRFEVAGYKVSAVDTTGAGDTFAGYLAAGLAEGMSPGAAMTLASGAAALKVTKKGTADAIPSRTEVDAFLARR